MKIGHLQTQNPKSQTSLDSRVGVPGLPSIPTNNISPTTTDGSGPNVTNLGEMNDEGGCFILDSSSTTAIGRMKGVISAGGERGLGDHGLVGEAA
ncbi:unnamed protein product [Linum trigynum]|uniref:Uncharacterized protein n=1 Tax=Linum trigynum TaxID=586398 RepID=A0AAV2FTQ3_9ROSI